MMPRLTQHLQPGGEIVQTLHLSHRRIVRVIGAYPAKRYSDISVDKEMARIIAFERREGRLR